MITKMKFVAIFLIVILSACNNQTPNVATNKIAISTPDTISLTQTPNARPTLKTTPAIVPTFIPASTIIPTITVSLNPTWFLLTRLTPVESIDRETAKSFVGLRIPPLPNGITREYVYSFPDGGELPSGTIFHQIFVMQRGNARMLWLGIPFALSTSWDESRIYDVIPIPDTQENDVLIAFTCSHNNEPDISLIVIADRPQGEKPATDIHYAWRIDPETTTLQPVGYRNIQCWPS
jgi:hypothetical protein